MNDVFNFYKETNIDQQVQDLGFENNCVLLNIGSTSIYIFVYFIKIAVLIVYIIILGNQNTPRYNGLKKSVYWSEFIDISLETYLDMLVAAVLNWQALPTVMYSDVSGNILSRIFMHYCFLVTLVIIPIMMLYILSSSIETI